MSNIISISLNENILQDLGIVEKHMGFSGRSEAIRAGLRMLIADYKEKEKMRGTITASILLVHEDSEEISEIVHHYQKIISTTVHNHLDQGKCLEILVLKGDAQQVKVLHQKLTTCKNVRFIKMVVV
jgi:CopG family transcriptional regulator, nickel-responsive regulator